MIKQNIVLLLFICALSHNVLAMEHAMKREEMFTLSQKSVQLACAEQLKKNLLQAQLSVFVNWENPAHLEVGSGRSSGTLVKCLAGRELAIGQLYDIVTSYINRYTQDGHEEAKRQRKSMAIDVSLPIHVRKNEVFAALLREKPEVYQDVIRLESLLSLDEKQSPIFDGQKSKL